MRLRLFLNQFYGQTYFSIFLNMLRAFQIFLWYLYVYIVTHVNMIVMKMRQLGI